LIALAEAFSRSGQFVQATEAYHDALQIEPASFDRDQIDEIRLALARTLLPQARFSEAIEQARQVLANGSQINAQRAEIIWGTALSIEGSDLEEAKKHLLAARGICEGGPTTDWLTLAQIKFELGSVLAQQGDLDQAVADYRESLAAANRSDQALGLEQRILSLNNLAYHLHLLGDPTAIEYAQAGLSLAREKGVLGLQAYLLSTSGELALAAGDLAQAENLFSEGLEIAEQSAIHERVAGLTANLGLVAIQQNQVALAIYRLSKALGSADALGTHHLAAQIRLWLAPLLPAAEARLRLAEVRMLVENSGRQGLLQDVTRLEEMIPD
jgi:tetratricopeptide (TPR) repeat protein